MIILLIYIYIIFGFHVDIDSPIQISTNTNDNNNNNDLEISPEQIAMISDMGFTSSQARKALRETVRETLSLVYLIIMIMTITN